MTLRQRILLAFFAFLAIAVVGSFFITKGIYNNARVRSLIEDGLNDALEGDFTVDRVEWVRFPLVIDIYGYEVRQDGERVIRVEKASLRISLRSIAYRFGVFVVSSAELTGVELNSLYVHDTDETHLQRAFKPTPSDTTSEASTRVTIKQISIDDLAVAVETGSGVIRLENARAQADEVYANVEVVRLDELFVSDTSGDFSLTVNGDIDITSDDPTLALDTQLFTPIALVHPLISKEMRQHVHAKGRLRATSAITGPSSNPRVAAKFGIKDARFLEVPLLEIEGHIATDLHLAELKDVTLEIPGGAAVVSGEVGLDDPQPYDLNITARNIPLQKLAHPFMDVSKIPAFASGRVTVRAPGVDEPISFFDADARISGFPKSWPSLVPDPLAVKAVGKLTLTHAVLDTMQAKAKGLHVDLSGSVPLEDGPFDCTVTIVDEDPTRTLRALEQNDLIARHARIEGKLGGTLNNPSAAGTLTADGVWMDGIQPGRLIAKFDLRNRLLRLPEARLSFTQGHLDVTGTLEILDKEGQPIDNPSVELGLTGTDLDLWAWSEEVAKGPVAFQAALTGPLDSISGPIDVQIPGLTMGTSVFPEATATLFLEPSQRLLVRDARLTPAEGGAVTASGHVRLNEVSYDIDVQGRNVTLAQLLALAEVELPFEEPSIVNTVSADVTGDLDRAHFNVKLDGAPGNATASGHYLLPTEAINFQARATLNGPEWTRLAGVDEFIDGEGTAKINGNGPLPFLDLDGSITLRRVSYEKRRVGTGRVDITIGTDVERNVWTMRAGLAGLGDARIEAERTDPLAAVASLTFSNVPVHDFLPQYGDQPILVLATGIGTARYEVDSGLASGTVQVTRLEASVQGSKDKIRNKRPVLATFDGEQINILPFEIEGKDGKFTAGGTIDDKLDLHAKGSLALGILPYVVKDIVTARGKLGIDVRVTGTQKVPALAGSIGLLEPARVRARALPREIFLDSAAIEVNNSKARVSALTGRIGRGSFNASGTATLEGVEPKDYDLHVQGNEIPLEASDFAVAVNVDGRVKSGHKGPDVTGRVSLLEGRYRRKFELRDFNFRAREPLEPRAPTSEFLSSIGLGVQMNATEPVSVLVDAGTFALRLHLVADVALTGTAAIPRLGGRLSAQRGVIAFPRASLDVTQADIDFSPAQLDLAADIALRAEGEVTPIGAGAGHVQQTYLVTVGLEGNLNEMRVTLSSEPELPPVQVLSLLVTGYANPANAGDQGGPQSTAALDAALAFTGAQIAGPLTKQVTDQLEKLLNLRLDLGTEVTSGAVRVTARKQFTERLYLEGAYQVEYGKNTSGDQTTTGSARFYVSDRIFIEGITQMLPGEAGSSSNEVDTRVEVRARVFGD